MIIRLILISFIFSFLHSETCDELDGEIRLFIKQRKKEKSALDFDTYNDIKDEYYSFIKEVRESCNDSIKQKKIMFFLQFYFSQWATKKQGDLQLYRSTLTYLKNNLIDSLLSNLKSETKNIKIRLDDISIDEQTMYILQEERNELNSQQHTLISQKSKVDNLLFNLNENYSDLVIFIKEKPFDEMVEIFNKISYNIVPIQIESPKIINDDPGKKQRIEFLKQSNLDLSFINYNPDDKDIGFYAKISDLPIVDKKARRRHKNTYAISVGESLEDIKRYRISFTQRAKDTLFIDFNHENWESKLEIPSEWTRLEIPNNLSWEYLDIDKNVLAYYNNKFFNKISDGTLIGIVKDKKIILYHKTNNESSNKYELKLTTNNKNCIKWINNGIVLLIPLILSFSADL